MYLQLLNNFQPKIAEYREDMSPACVNGMLSIHCNSQSNLLISKCISGSVIRTILIWCSPYLALWSHPWDRMGTANRQCSCSQWGWLDPGPHEVASVVQYQPQCRSLAYLWTSSLVSHLPGEGEGDYCTLVTCMHRWIQLDFVYTYFM